MDCKEAQALLSAYVDGETSAGESLAVAEHLAACAACQAQHASLLALTAGLRRHGERHHAPAALFQHLETAFPLETSNITAPSPSSPPIASPEPAARRWLHWTWTDLGAAAALMLAVIWSLGLYLALPGRDDALADEVLASHVRSQMSGHPVDVASSDQHTVKPWFSGKLDFSPPVLDLTTEGFPLVGGRVDYINRRNVAALVYRHRQHMIDVYVFPAASGAHDKAAVKLTRQGYNLYHWTRGGMNYWAVSDLDAAELQALESILATR